MSKKLCLVKTQRPLKQVTSPLHFCHRQCGLLSRYHHQTNSRRVQRRVSNVFGANAKHTTKSVVWTCVMWKLA